MRVIATIPHPSIRISVFSMNDKYIVKLEAGPMEQTYKFTEDEVKGVDDIRRILDAEFLQKALDRFNEMFVAMKAARERNPG